MKTPEDYFIFDLPAYTYFNDVHVGQSPKIQYRDIFISDGWYCKFEFGKNGVVRVPKEAWLNPGKIFFEWIEKGDEDFTTHLFDVYKSIIPFTNKVEQISLDELQTGVVPSVDTYYPEYRSLFSQVIGFGCPLDAVLEEYAKEHAIDLASVPVYGESFLKEEERDLQKISNELDVNAQGMLLEKHAKKYSYLFNNYTGYHTVPISYFRERLADLQEKHIPEAITKEWGKPRSIQEWIGFGTYIRDQRKKCNMIVNGLLDRYLRSQCDAWSLMYEEAVLLTPAEFEIQKLSGLQKFKIRYVFGGRSGLEDISTELWDGLITTRSDMQKPIKGTIASKGKVTGEVKVVMNPGEFGKVSKGDVLVTTMTTPNYGPILGKVSAIVTNVGGITCHAAIISRELGIPCIISTGNATEVLKDGDLVEVDANNGVVNILNRFRS